LTQASVDAVLNELVLDAERGKAIGGAFMNIVCFPENDCSGASQQFQKITIYYNAGRDEGMDRMTFSSSVSSSRKPLGRKKGQRAKVTPATSRSESNNLASMFLTCVT
jgi:hypothetical protein